MADLSPDLSIYSALAGQQKSFVPTDMVGIMGAARQARELQTQGAVSDALRSSGGDPNAALKALMQPGAPGFMTPEIVSQMTHAAGAVSDLQRDYATKVAHDVGTLITKKGLTAADIIQRVPTWKAMGVPQPIIDDVLQNVINPDGKTVNMKGLASYKNWADNNAGLPMAPEETLPSGQTRQRPAGEVIQEGAAGGGAGAGGAGGPGSVITSLPRGAGSTKEAAAKDAVSLINQGPALANNRSTLLSLDDLSARAATGPTAPLERELSQLAERFGYKGPLSAAELKATEGYGKLAASLQQQMAINGFGAVGGGHATDAFLANAQSAMPNLQLSRLGRQGITHWLLGNNDAMQVMQQEWSKWIGAHPNREGDYYSWLNGQLKDADGKGFDMAHFDPRVFQYERMTPTEQEEFEKMIQGSRELARFKRNIEAYEKRGWIGPNGIASQ